MSGSEPGEMASKSSKVVVFPKFDMYIYTFELTSSELRKAVEEYDIPSDLHPRLPPSGYDDEPTPIMSLKGWKKKIFLLDHCAVPEAMPWRHGDNDLHDDFSVGYDDHDVARLSEFLVPLRPPSLHLLYVCGLTTLPSWTGTVVSRGDPILEDQRPKPRITPPLGTGVKIPELTAFQKSLEKPNPKIAAAREKKEQQSLAKAEAKRAGAGGAEGPKKKQNGTSHVEKEVVDLSGNTRVPTPSAATVPPSPRAKHHDTQKHATSDAHSSQSSHQGHEDEPVNNQYVPNWGLRNDLRVCTFRACRELVSHLVTPAEDDFLGNISNVEVISRVYQTLGQSVLAQGELLKRHEQLSHDYVDLVNESDANFAELDRLRLILQRENQNNEGLANKLSLLDSAHSECPFREKELLDRVKDLERERMIEGHCFRSEKIGGLERKKLALSAEVALCLTSNNLFGSSYRLGLSLGKTEDQIAQFLSEAKDLDTEGLKLYEAKHRELFTMSYPYVQKVADSYGLSMTELLKVSSDIPSSVDEETASSTAAEEASKKPPSSPSKVAFKTPFGTTT
nr:hypothetical protein [Tanacetum cinerariifolium]